MHVMLQPFSVNNCNKLETVSLTMLMFISIINLLKATYFESGSLPHTTAKTLFRIYDWIEAILLGVIPSIVMAVVAISIPITIIFYIKDKWCKGQKNSSSQEDTSYIPKHDSLTPPRGKSERVRSIRPLPDGASDLHSTPKHLPRTKFHDDDNDYEDIKQQKQHRSKLHKDVPDRNQYRVFNNERTPNFHYAHRGAPVRSTSMGPPLDHTYMQYAGRR